MTTTYPEAIDLPDGGFLLRSPAKLNLCLQVLGKRPDGYHELDTLFQEIDWFDDLEFRSAGEWRFELENAPGLDSEDNLVIRAARSLSEASGHPLCGHILLRKRLPIGGGLGGGSSNGTIALIGLSRLWGLNWATERLVSLAGALGSDTSFFLHGGLARGRGRGEQIEPLIGACPSWFLVVIPHFSIFTSLIFEIARYPLTDSSKSVIFQSRINPNVISENWAEGLFNDLENIVLGEFPALKRLKASLLASGAEAALLSGSGSCMYGIFRERDLAKRAARGLGSELEWRICRGVARR